MIRKCVQCGKLPRVRGLCTGCYNRTRRLVLSGTTTWEELEVQGKSLPAKPPGWAFKANARRVPVQGQTS